MRPASSCPAARPFADVRAIDAGQWGDRLQVAMERQDPPLLTTRVRQKLPAAGSGSTPRPASSPAPSSSITTVPGTRPPSRSSPIDRQNDFLITLEATHAAAGAGSPRPTPSRPASTASSSSSCGSAIRRTRRATPIADRPRGLRQPLARQPPQPLLRDGHRLHLEHDVAGDDAQTTACQRLRRCGSRARKVSRSTCASSTSTSRRARTASGPGRDLRRRDQAARRGSSCCRSATATTCSGQLSDPTYIGADDVDPEQRTGLFSAAQHRGHQHRRRPGPHERRAAERADRPLRADALPLRGPRRPAPPRDAIADVQAQRQQFDTKYAALYHPWLLIARPVPDQPGDAARYPIPPSRPHARHLRPHRHRARRAQGAGQRGRARHHRPAARCCNKEQHDILNPYPVNINVIRDFRAEQPRHPRLRRPGDHQRLRLEVRQRPAAADLHRGVDRPRPAVGRVRAQRRAAVGARAARDHELPDASSGATARSKAPRRRRRSSSSATAPR